MNAGLVRSGMKAIALCAVLGAAASVKADAMLVVDPGAAWQGYMNVFELPSNGGAYLWGSAWGVADLSASFSGPVLTLAPNSINDPSSYWYTPAGGPGSTGAKIMDANLYVEVTGTYAGQTVTFSGNVLSNTFTSAHTAVAFVKDFAPDYSSFNVQTVALAPGEFSVSLATDGDPARHVQYGFTVNGPDVWVTDVAPFGSVQIAAVPEPGIMLVGASVAGLLAIRRRQA